MVFAIDFGTDLDESHGSYFPSKVCFCIPTSVRLLSWHFSSFGFICGLLVCFFLLCAIGTVVAAAGVVGVHL